MGYLVPGDASIAPHIVVTAKGTVFLDQVLEEYRQLFLPLFRRQEGNIRVDRFLLLIRDFGDYSGASYDRRESKYNNIPTEWKIVPLIPLVGTMLSRKDHLT
jgi:hypothetical protein